MDAFQLVLPSGRGVRYRLLTPSEQDQALLDAATLVGKDATNAAVGTTRLRESVKRMLHSVTTSLLAEKKEPGPDGKERVVSAIEQLATAKWEKLDAQKLALPGPLQFDALFTAKDDAVLCHVHRINHELSKDEADAIVGKAQPVSVD